MHRNRNITPKKPNDFPHGRGPGRKLVRASKRPDSRKAPKNRVTRTVYRKLRKLGKNKKVHVFSSHTKR